MEEGREPVPRLRCKRSRTALGMVACPLLMSVASMVREILLLDFSAIATILGGVSLVGTATSAPSTLVGTSQTIAEDQIQGRAECSLPSVRS
jgi:hypothetical protein